MKRVSQALVIVCVALLLQACTAIPVSTMIKMAGFGADDLAQIDPAQLRVRMSVPDGFELDAKEATLNLTMSQADGRSREVALALELVERSRVPRSTGLFSAGGPMPTQVLRLTPQSARQLASFRTELLERQRGKGDSVGFRIAFGFAKRPPAARSVTLWADLKLAKDEDWFALLDGMTLQFKTGGG